MIADTFLEFIFIVITSQIFVYQIYYFIRNRYQKIKNNIENYYYLDTYIIELKEEHFFDTLTKICVLKNFVLSDIDLTKNIIIIFKKPKIGIDFGFNFLIQYKYVSLETIEIKIYCSNFDRFLYPKKKRLENLNDLMKLFLLFNKKSK